MADPAILEGTICALRLFDVAYAADLGQAQALWAAQAGGGAGSRARLASTPAKAMAFGDPPLELALPAARLVVAGAETAAEVTVRLYAFGVVGIALRFPAGGLGWAEFTAHAGAIQAAVGPEAVAPVWAGILHHLRGAIGPALRRSNASPLSEDYLLATVHRFDRPVDVAEFGRAIDLVPLLSGEQRPLAEQARAELLARRFSYFTDDLVVLTWDRAFIYEPRRDTDVEDVIEAANAQLLEMRYYDELLDGELPRMYDLVDDAARSRRLMRPSGFAALARRLYMLVAEVTELTEQADNTLQVTEDVYLARVYAAALEVLRVPAFQAAVDRKLAIIRDTYSALYDEAAGSRATLLEVAVVLLIVIEVILPFVIRH